MTPTPHPLHRVSALTRQVRRALRTCWQLHRDQLANNAAYTATLAALAATLVTQDRLIDLITTLIAGLLAIYRACLRDLTRA